MAGYRSQIVQSLHYFGRPNEGVRREPLHNPSVWRGDEIANDPAWRQALTSEDIAEIETAIAHAKKTGKPVEMLRAIDFPLPRFRANIDRFRHALRHGRGFQLVTGVPVDRWSEEDCSLFFWCFGLHLGIPGAQNPAGDLLGHVRDTGAPSDGSVRQYRTREDIDFHCDVADVVGLLCVVRAKTGGTSRVASSTYAYNQVLSKRPDLIDRLYRPFWFDTKGEGGVPYVGIVPCAHFDGDVSTYWHSGYYRSVVRYDPPPEIDAQARALLNLYDEIFREPGVSLEMDFAPGDIQLLSNHTIVHGRTGFEDYDEPAKKRHLLRLWLSLPEASDVPRSLPRKLSIGARTAVGYAQVLGQLAAARVRSLAK